MGAFQRGDILFISKVGTMRAGQLVLFKLAGRDTYIAHRVIKAHSRGPGDFDILTKASAAALHNASLPSQPCRSLSLVDVERSLLLWGGSIIGRQAPAHLHKIGLR